MSKGQIRFLLQAGVRFVKSNSVCYIFKSKLELAALQRDFTTTS